MSQKKLNKKLNLLFKNLKIKKGDKIILHSNIAGILQYANINNSSACNFFFNYIKRYIGKKGTLIIPTYNYDFTKGKPFDRKTTLSQVGEFGNYLIKKHYNNRTFDPVFSHIIFGKLKKKILNCETNEAFGDKSIFNLILQEKFRIICFCCSSTAMTFIHFIEKKMNVDYRFNKNFNSFVKINNKNIKVKYKYFVGKKNINYNLNEKKITQMLKTKIIVKKFGRFDCSQIDTKTLYNILKVKLEKNKRILLK